jgi:hypothetical protein
VRGTPRAQMPVGSVCGASYPRRARSLARVILAVDCTGRAASDVKCGTECSSRCDGGRDQEGGVTASAPGRSDGGMTNREPTVARHGHVTPPRCRFYQSARPKLRGCMPRESRRSRTLVDHRLDLVRRNRAVHRLEHPHRAYRNALHIGAANQDQPRVEFSQALSTHRAGKSRSGLS